MDGLTQAYIAYLRDPAAGRAGLTGHLAQAGYALDAGLLRQAGAGRPVVTLVAGPGVWAGRRVVVGLHLPAAAAPGDLWFDPLEVVPMLLVPAAPPAPPDPPAAPGPADAAPGYAWLALRPVAHWQFAAFLALAPVAPRVVQVAPPFRLLDPARILRGAPTAPVTRLTAGEARMYAGWFGKGLARQYARQLAARFLPGAAAAALWGAVPGEWAGSYDEGVELAVTPATLARDPQAEEDGVAPPAGAGRMLYGEWATSAAIGFRTGVLCQTGLFSRPFTIPTSFDNVCVTGILARAP